MKNLLLLSLTFMPFLGFSQEKAALPTNPKSGEKFSLGLLGGIGLNYMPYHPNIAQEEGTINSRLTPEHTFFAGVSARLPLLHRIAAKMDVQLASKGYGMKRLTFAPTLEHFQAYYVDMAPQLEYKVYKNLYASLGGYVGVKLSERVKYSDQDWATIDPGFINLAEKTDAGLSSGLRAEFGRFSALVKYQHGLTTAIKTELTDESGGDTKANQRHRTLQIGLGYRLL